MGETPENTSSDTLGREETVGAAHKKTYAELLGHEAPKRQLSTPLTLEDIEWIESVYPPTCLGHGTGGMIQFNLKK